MQPEIKSTGFQPCQTAIPLPKDAIADFCALWRIDELYLFGSILRKDDFHADSDIDIMVKFASDAHRSLFDLVEMKESLEAMLFRKVDLMTTASIEESNNWIRRKEILKTARLLYVSR